MITKMILLITLLVFSSLKFEPRVISAQEEARVISAYINAFYLKKEYADNIFTGRPNRIIVMLDKTLQCECETPLRKIAARNGIAIVQDFVNQNRKQAAYRNEGVEKYFTFALPYSLITREIFDKIISDGGWKRFYDVYPDSRGIVGFSRIGMNEDKTMAMLYFLHGYNEGQEEGVLVVLRIYGDKWIKIDQELVYIA